MDSTYLVATRERREDLPKVERRNHNPTAIAVDLCCKRPSGTDCSTFRTQLQRMEIEVAVTSEPSRRNGRTMVNEAAQT